MVAAYLRGLLKPDMRHGLRSILAEEVVLEGLVAEATADGMEASMKIDAAMLTLLTEKGVRETVDRMALRTQRCSELRFMDVYKVQQQLEGRLKVANRKSHLSTFQLYQIAEKHGIFDAVNERAPATERIL